MSFDGLSAHDRSRAWEALRRRAKVTPQPWHVPAVAEATAVVTADGRFDGLLIEEEYKTWNDTAGALTEAVAAELNGRWPGHERTMALYASLYVCDLSWLPSRQAMEAFARVSLRMRAKWGLTRDMLVQSGPFAWFESRGRPVPRVVLRAVGGATMVDLTSSWPTGGFTAIHAVNDSSGTLIVLDVQAREEDWIDPALLADLEPLVAAWQDLLDEHDGQVYLAEMNTGHRGLEPFPG